MNYRANQTSARTLPTVKDSCSRRQLVRAFSIIILGLLGLVFLNSATCLKAADGAVTNTTAATPDAADDTTNRVNVLDDQYRLSIGDQLSFRILEDEDDPKILGVTDSGDLEVPYIGRYPAVGKTCKQLAQELKVELEKKYYLHASVVVAVNSKPRSRGKIYIVGAIGAPGPQDIASDEKMTLSKAILRAGGFTSFADGKNVRVTRSFGTHAGSETNFTVNVSQIFEQGKTEEDPPLQPGDLIFIPERMIRF